MTDLFGRNEAFGVLMAELSAYPLCACGGGTQWLWEGMRVGSAVSYMLTGPATEITDLCALKIVLRCLISFNLFCFCHSSQDGLSTGLLCFC